MKSEDLKYIFDGITIKNYGKYNDRTRCRILKDVKFNISILLEERINIINRWIEKNKSRKFERKLLALLEYYKTPEYIQLEEELHAI
jgi:hypothetical protein